MCVFVCACQEAVRRAVLCGRLPCLQAFLRSQNRPEQTLPELRRVGLQHAFRCLAQRQLPHATTLFRNMVPHPHTVSMET